MQLNLGEAPKGWFSVFDDRYRKIGIGACVMELVIFIVIAILISPDPAAVIFHGAFLALLFMSILGLFAIDPSRSDETLKPHRATFCRNFRVGKTENLVEELMEMIPRAYRPVAHTSEKESVVPGDKVTKETLETAKSGDQKYVLEMTVKHARHFVHVEVKVSDRDSLETADMMDRLLTFFQERSMDWLSVDVAEDADLLMTTSQEERRRTTWDVAFTKHRWDYFTFILLTLLGVLWVVMLASMFITNNEVLTVGSVISMLISYLLIAILVYAMGETKRRTHHDVMCEYERRFHASPWYVTIAIEEGLSAAKTGFVTKRRVDPTAQVPAETFVLTGASDKGVTIDVSWDAHETDPNWSWVRVRTSREMTEIQSILDIVRRAVFWRHELQGPT
jgi:hypothetical protein